MALYLTNFSNEGNTGTAIDSIDFGSVKVHVRCSIGKARGAEVSEKTA